MNTQLIICFRPLPGSKVSEQTMAITFAIFWSFRPLSGSKVSKQYKELVKTDEGGFPSPHGEKGI